jgi:hypothetical protein
MLAILGLLIAIAGALVVLAASLWFTIESFQESVGWGLACLFIPFANLVFLMIHWDRGGKPFLFGLAGFGVVTFGQVVAIVGGA